FPREQGLSEKDHSDRITPKGGDADEDAHDGARGRRVRYRAGTGQPVPAPGQEDPGWDGWQDGRRLQEGIGHGRGGQGATRFGKARRVGGQGGRGRQGDQSLAEEEVSGSHSGASRAIAASEPPEPFLAPPA